MVNVTILLLHAKLYFSSFNSSKFAERCFYWWSELYYLFILVRVIIIIIIIITTLTREFRSHWISDLNKEKYSCLCCCFAHPASMGNIVRSSSYITLQVPVVCALHCSVLDLWCTFCHPQLIQSTTWVFQFCTAFTSLHVN